MKSIIREEGALPIGLAELYEKIRKEEFQHHVKILVQRKNKKTEAFEILTVLGKGRSVFAFLSLKDRKLTALRMSYEKEKLTGKFDSIVETEADSYNKYFLEILYPAVPIRHLYSGVLRQKAEIGFDKTVFVSIWEKADATLVNKLDENFEKKYQWFRQLLAGLNFIHSRDRIHLDIKLDNLFLVDNRVKIGDFEFYSRLEDFKQSDIFICGTPGHIAPEMFYHKEDLTAKIDVFSAGIAFAHFFSAELPAPLELTPAEYQQLEEILKKCEKNNHFDQANIPEIEKSLSYSFFYRRHFKEKIATPGLDTFERFVYEDVLLKMMDLDPDSRPGVQEIIDRLEENTPPAKKPAKTTAKTGAKAAGYPKWLLFVVGFLVVAAGLFLYFLFSSSEKHNPPPDIDTGKAKIVKSPLQENQGTRGKESPGKKRVTKPTRQKHEPTQKKVEPVITVPPPQEKKPGISAEEKKELKDQTKYETYLDIVNDLVRAKDYQRALDMIARAKQIKISDNLLEIERKIRQLLEQQQKYEAYFAEAQRFYEKGNFEAALRNIGMARDIRNTPQLNALETEIHRKLKEKDEEYERGLILVAEKIATNNYSDAKKLITTLKKIRVNDTLLKLENAVDRELALVARQRQEEESEYLTCLQKAQAYMDRGSFAEAGEEIQKARKIKNSALLTRLEEKLKELKGQAERDYEMYYRWARIYFEQEQLEQARHYLELAREIYRSHDVVVLEMEIAEKIKAREDAAVKAAEKQNDDEAYFKAARGNQVGDLDDYLKKYPEGLHVREANERLNKIFAVSIPMVEEPRLLKKVEPYYSRNARKKDLPGVVWVEATIDRYGDVTRVQVIEGHRLLNSEAIRAVKQWKYEPCIIGGKARTVRFRAKVLFGQPGV